ncbi:MAG: peptidase [Hyphomicrobiales bacterium]|nr:MAG: peptidase [Hyphomicrobiales bacterium]
MGFVLLLLLIAGLGFGPTLWVKRVMARHAKDRPDLPGTGGELARHLLDEYGLKKIKVVATDGGDCYDPESRTVRLSQKNYEGKSVTAVAVAAHEVSHAIQHHDDYKPFMRRQSVVRTGIVIDRVGSALLFGLSIMGSAAFSPRIMIVGIAATIIMGIARVFSQVSTLPVEIDASFERALPILIHGKYLNDDDLKDARSVLKAAAYTYVAAAIAQVLNLARFLRR